MALDSFPIPAKECWRWRCFLVLDFVCFMLNRNPGVKKIHIYDTQLICKPGTRTTKNRNSKFRIQLKQSWSTINASSALEIQIQRKKQKTYWWNRVDLQSRHRWLTERRQTNPRSLVPTQLPWSTNTNTITNTNTKKNTIHTRPLVPAQSPG